MLPLKLVIASDIELMKKIYTVPILSSLELCRNFTGYM